jgi:hypothetical protein
MLDHSKFDIALTLGALVIFSWRLYISVLETKLKIKGKLINFIIGMISRQKP